MKKLYKFMHKRHVKSLLGGTVRFSNFKSFRDLPPPIGDITEGWATVESGKYAYDPAHGEQPLGPNITLAEGVKNARFTDLTLQWELPDIYISCFSYGEFDALAAKIMHRGKERYDAAVEVLDEALLGVELVRSGIIRSTGQSVQQAFGPMDGRLVTYAGPLTAPITQEQINSCVFRKHWAYEPQQEFRMAAQPPILLDTSVFIDCPAAKWLFKRVA